MPRQKYDAAHILRLAKYCTVPQIADRTGYSETTINTALRQHNAKAKEVKRGEEACRLTSLEIQANVKEYVKELKISNPCIVRQATAEEMRVFDGVKPYKESEGDLYWKASRNNAVGNSFLCKPSTVKQLQKTGRLLEY